MRNRGFIRKVAIIGCLAMLVTLLPLLTLPANAATWEQVANNGGTNANNKFALPGEDFQGNLTIGSIWLPAIAPYGPGPVSMYTYDGSAFTAIPTAGFEDSANNLCLISTAEYDGKLQIGTFNDLALGIGSELYTWDGSGNPDPVPVSNHGWGVGVANNTTVPLGVINGELVVSVSNDAGAPDGGCRMYKYDGSNWTQIIGQGAPGTPTGPGFGDFDNTTVVMPMGETTLYQDKMILSVQNQAVGKGLSVYAYDGSIFTLIGKAGDPGVWTTDNKIGGLTTSLVDGKVYMGTYKDPAAGQGGEIWSYDGSNWTRIIGQGAPGTPTGPGFGDPNNYALPPLVRGSDLYVASWNDTDGCRIRKRDGSSFNTISDSNFGQNPLVDRNNCAILKSYQGKLYACTANQSGYEIWRTDIPPSIDRLVPNSGPYGATVAIEGHDFKNQRGNGTVTFNGAEAPDVLSWSDTRIEVMVPPKATAGPVQVKQSNGDSNEVDFTVTLSDTYYFAEGTTRDNATDGTYEQWLCLQNPGATVAKVTITYMLEDGTTEVQKVSVDPESRKTVSVNDFLGPDKDVSTLVESDQLILAERPMYFNYRSKWTGGHDVIGVPAPRDTYYFAEGTTRDNVYDGTYEEWLCLQNPGATKAEVTVTYMLGTGRNVVKTYDVGATSRRTVDVNTAVGPDQDVSMLVESTQPIVAERPMYFNYRETKWTGGHNVVGAPGPDTEFYFAEGTTRDNPTDGSFEEWLCLQNPSDTDAKVTITYYTEQAGTQTQNVTVGAKSRHTVDVKLRLGSDVDTACKVESTNDVPILAERPMYFNYNSVWPGGHNVMGCNAPKRSYYFAEGTTLTEFSTYVAVMNPGANRATVKFTYMIEGKANQQKTVTIDPSKRFTQNVASVIGVNKNVSMLLESDQPIVAERPMYFGYKGWCAGGHDTLGYGI